MSFQEIRYAFRSLLKDRAVTAIVVACLALGIGINATLFSVVDGVLLQPLPFVEPDRLVLFNETFERGGIREAGVSYLDLRDWKAATTSYTNIVGISGRNLALSDGGEPERLIGAAVSWDLFPMLGVPPAIGPSLRPRRRSPGRRTGRHAEPRNLDAPLSRRPVDRRPQHLGERQAPHRHRRDAPRLCVP